MKKCEYVIKEINQPSSKALRQFHEHIAEIISRSTRIEADMDTPLPKVHHSTQDLNET